MTTKYTYQPETIAQVTKLTPGTIAHQSHLLGMHSAEPLIVALDSMIRYAKAHKARFESPLAEDYFLGPQWLEAVKGIRALLNGDGAVAHELGRTTDSKDNGACEGMFWAALEAAGFADDSETVDMTERD